MRVLILGGTGRLSTDVAKLASENAEVFLFTRGTKDRDIFLDKKCYTIKGNIRDKNNAIDALGGLNFDVVVDFLSFNIDQMKNTLDIVENICSQYVFISSATVYDYKDGEVISEEKTKLGNPKWEYAYDKYVCEQYLAKVYSEKKMKYTIIRPYVTYGLTRIPYPLVPRDSSMEWSFVQRIIEGRPVPSFNNGNTITTLTNTKDFAKGIVGVFGNYDAYNKAFHITNDETCSWGQVIEVLQRELGIKANVIDVDIKSIIRVMPEYRGVLYGDKTRNTIFDNSKIKEVVPGFKCDISIDRGLKEVLAFYDANPELKKIDYMWNGKIDRLFHKKMTCNEYCLLDRKDMINYLKGRYLFLNWISESFIIIIIKKIKHFVANIIKESDNNK